MPVVSRFNGGAAPDLSKLAIQLKLRSFKIKINSNYDLNYFMHFHKNVPLSESIVKLIRHWKLDGLSPEKLCLRFEDGRVIGEENKHQLIKDGIILELQLSPDEQSREIIEFLTFHNQQEEEANKMMLLVESACRDKIVAPILVSNGVLHHFFKLLSVQDVASTLFVHVASALSCLTYLVKWDQDEYRPDISVVQKIAQSIAFQKRSWDDELGRLYQASLSILQTIVVSSVPNYTKVQSVLSFQAVLSLLKCGSAVVQEYALALVNALFERGDKSAKKRLKASMEENETRSNILKYIIFADGGLSVRMKNLLYTLQYLLLNELEDRLNTRVDARDTKALEKIKELRCVACVESHPTNQLRTNRFSQNYKKLGFKNYQDPVQDFQDTPPGALALDLMYNFVLYHTDVFTKLMVENSYRNEQYECPFATSSIKLVKLICSDIIGIGRPPASAGIGSFYPMFFSHDNALEEMFSICVIHFHKNWRDMRATHEDFDRVLDTVREQIMSSLAFSPLTLEAFQKGLKSYAEIVEIWKEATKNKCETREGRAVRELRELLRPNVVELVQRQRLNFLKEGTSFHGRGSRRFVRLSANHKMLCCTEINSQDESVATSGVGTSERMLHKLNIVDVKDFICGAAAANTVCGRSANRSVSATTMSSLSISIITMVNNVSVSLDLVAPDQKTFEYWCDGLNILLQRGEMTSTEAARDIDNLLSMEVKIRLLDLEGIDIPEEPSIIPPLPENFNVCCE